MPAGRFSRNTVLAGVFVLAIIALFVVAVVLLTKAGDWSFDVRTYTVRFDLDEGAEGLEKGSAVKLGGKRVGRVLRVDFDPPPESGAEVTALLVRIEVRSDLVLYEDAVVTLQRPLLGSNSALNILKLRSSPDAGRIAENGVIDGRISPPGFFRETDYAAVQNFLKRLDRWSADVDRDWPAPYDDVKATIASAREATENIAVLVQETRGRWDEWVGEIDGVIRQVRPRFDDLTARAQETVDRARNAAAEVEQAVVENRPRVNAAIEDFRALMEKANGEAYSEALTTIRKARETMEYAADAARRADEFITTRSPELGEIITSAALAAQQLKLATIEIRAAPWRLLYQPTRKELENELLYNSVRQYSQSLAEVRAAAEALESATQAVAAAQQDGVGRPAIDPATMDQLTQRLREAMDRAAEQERAFFERWVATPQGR